MVFRSSIVVLAAILASPSSAFVSTFTGSSIGFVVPETCHHRNGNTALSMNLFDRFSRVAKSNLNNVLKNLEDPEKIMNQAVEDMQVRYNYYFNYYNVHLLSWE